MIPRARVFRGLAMAVVLGSAMGLACSGGDGVSKADYDAVKAELEELQKKEAEGAGVTVLFGAKAIPTPTQSE